MGKYLMVVLIFLIAGMIIAMTKDPIDLVLFYGSLAGALIAIGYGTWQSRKEKQRMQKERRKSRK